MIKQMLLVLCGVSLAFGNSEVSIFKGEKDYDNSMTNVKGDSLNLNISHKFDFGKLSIGYLKDNVKRIHSISKADLTDLEVKKYNAKYRHFINQKLDLKVSYIKILDNLAPTDQGKVYGIGTGYKLSKGFGVNVDYYKSDYIPFDVDQYDLAVYKGFKINELKAKVTLGTKIINIDGTSYNPGNTPLYNFYDKSYDTQFVKLGLNYKGFVAGAGAFFGKNLFTILDNGTKVQHHAREIDKAYMFSLGKKFKNFDIVAKYSYKDSNELPENRNNVAVKVTGLALSYRF